ALGLLASPALAASDLPASHGFYEEMTYLLGKEIITGYPDGTVQPDKIVTRAEAAIMIGKLKDFDGTQRATKFSDVTKGQKASGFIAAAQEPGIISGYGDGTFRPYAPITRGDMAIILSRVFATPIFGPAQFTDVSVNMKAHDAIYQVLGANIAAGYRDRTFRPTAPTTRGQFSAFLARGLEPKFKNDTHMAGTYLRDKTKAYTYRYAGNITQVHTFENVESYMDEPLGFIWSVDHAKGLQDYYVEMESYELYGIGYPRSEFYTDLVYPVKTGVKFNTDSYIQPPAQITGVNVRVETPYRTFTNAVEVTVPDNAEFAVESYKYYMVPGFGSVKVVNKNGTVAMVLAKVE
ncbi:MAG TPA: S-layer homology domain-containing protein, partial [Planococcus sp. (in: firmicutes)]|nr:S-layer homology domain-containing protein [Planococcus sp. (in: firmicutes)]